MRRAWTNGMHSIAAAALAGLILGQPIAAGARAKKTEDQIDGQQRILHVLNRFTFGPRPGDVAAVKAMGLQRWFEQQLNPSTIDDSAL